MVLSLVELSVLAVRNGIEDGSIRIRGNLPFDIRKCIFNALSMHGTLDSPNSTDLIAQHGFLDGFTSFDVKNSKANVQDVSAARDFIDRVTPVFTSSLGTNITDLRVHLFYNPKATGGSTLPGIVRLVAQCPNLTKLVLRCKPLPEGASFNDEERQSATIFRGHKSPNILNVFDAVSQWVPILERLEKLAIFGDHRLPILSNCAPSIRFEKLTTLHLSTCQFERYAWRDFLTSLQSTLKSLSLIDCVTPVNLRMFGTEEANVSVLPVPMPRLEVFKLRYDSQWMFHFDDVVRNLARCPLLTNTYLDMTLRIHVDEQEFESEPELARFQSNVDIGLCLNHSFLDDSVFEDQAVGDRFRFVPLFGARMKDITIAIDTSKWNVRFTRAFAHMIDTCRNLSSFVWVPFSSATGESEAHAAALAEFRTSSKRELVKLFIDPDRAAKLTKLGLSGDYDESLLDLIIENCTNLKDLSIYDCPQFTDQHLIDSARRGVTLSKLCLMGCPNVRGDGIERIMASSGSSMRYLRWNVDGEQRESVEMALIQHCKYVKGEFRLESMKTLASECCYYIGSDWNPRKHRFDETGPDF